MTIAKALGVVLFVLLFNPCARAQIDEKVRQTYSGPDVSSLWELLKETGAKDARVEVLKFTPAGDSGVSKALADALGGTPEERAALVQAFAQLKQAYEAEVAREGKLNNLGAAMTFFIAANVMSYYQTEMPSDADVAKLMESLQQAMARIPAFARMSGPEKHKMHDWLVYMGGFALTNYMEAKQRNDAQGLATMKQFADYALRLALGVEAKNLRLSGARIVVDGPSTTTAVASSASGKILGAWSTSSAVNNGHIRLRYTFNADGSYSFKSERNITSQRWWTIEESGSYSVNGDTLTINPQTSKATLRNLNGVVQETRANALEKVAYKWTTHFFEGIGETNLVLQPPAATSRDGILGSNSLFPNAYLYTQGDKLEWRF
ncbi:MAG TPA: lipocalin family protein [Pyrinomonadaceae bacterium]|nr:lipocalin family protein [Pyrinomonadaceae bacterium]